MNDMQRWVDVQVDTEILAEIKGRDVKTLSEHVGKVRLRTKAEIQGDIKDGSITAAQLVYRSGEATLADVFAQRDPCRFFEQFLHMPQRVA